MESQQKPETQILDYILSVPMIYKGVYVHFKTSKGILQ